VKKTGDETLDFVLGAGPRALTADTPQHIRLEIAKSSELGPYREACKLLAQQEIVEMHKEIELVSIENQSTDWQATRTYIPAYRIPLGMYLKMEGIYGKGCWQDKDFVEDTLKHHPGLSITVKRGIHGQQYVKRQAVKNE
jgi:hypothetical protein